MHEPASLYGENVIVCLNLQILAALFETSSILFIYLQSTCLRCSVQWFMFIQAITELWIDSFILPAQEALPDPLALGTHFSVSVYLCSLGAGVGDL